MSCDENVLNISMFVGKGLEMKRFTHVIYPI